MKPHIAMEIGDSYPACQWHANSAPGSAEERLVEYVENAEEGTPLFQRLEADLRECRDCMGVYHEARERLIQAELDYDRKLFELEGRRVVATLRRDVADELDVLLPVITEILWHPFLLLSQDIESAFCERLLELNESTGLEWFLPECIPTMYLLLIHPRSKIRELAWHCLQNPKYKITPEICDDVSPVLQWVISVQLSGRLNVLPVATNEVIRTPSQVEELPRHLFHTASQIPYWQGVARLLEIFSVDALKHSLMVNQSLKMLIPSLIDCISSIDSSAKILSLSVVAVDHKSINRSFAFAAIFVACLCSSGTPKSAVSVRTLSLNLHDTAKAQKSQKIAASVNDLLLGVDASPQVPVPRVTLRSGGAAKSQSPFWHQLQCLASLMDKLGSSIWQDVSQFKILNFFDIIKGHPIFKQAMESDVLMSSQPNVSMQHLRLASFQASVGPTEPVGWIEPYISSLLDFGASASSNFIVVIDFLCTQLSDLLNLGWPGNQQESDGVQRLTPLDSLRAKLMLVLIRVLQSLLRTSLLGQLMEDIGAQQWLEIFVTFLRDNPPVRAKRGVSVLTDLANDCREFLIDVFKLAQRNKTNIPRSTKYIRMLGPSQLPSSGTSRTLSPGNMQRRLWEIPTYKTEFEECVEFVEETLREHSLAGFVGNTSGPRDLPKPKTDLSDVAGTSRDRSSDAAHSSPPTYKSPGANASSSLVAPKTSRDVHTLNERNAQAERLDEISSECASKPSEEATRPPATNFQQDCLRQTTTIKQEAPSTPQPSHSRIPTTIGKQSTSQANQMNQSFSDEINLISDISSDEVAIKVEEDQEWSVMELMPDSEEIYEINSDSSPEEVSPNDVKGSAPDDESEVQESSGQLSVKLEVIPEHEGSAPDGDLIHQGRWQPSVQVEVIQELEDMSESEGQFIVLSTEPLTIRRAGAKRDLDTNDSESSLTDVDFRGDVHSKHQKRKQKRARHSRLEHLESSDDESRLSCSQQLTPKRSSSDGSTFSSSFSLSSTSPKSSWHSSTKYPKNRLSRSRRLKRIKNNLSSSSDEHETDRCDLEAHESVRREHGSLEIKKELSVAFAAAAESDESHQSLHETPEVKKEREQEDEGERLESEENTRSSHQPMLSDDQVLDYLEDASSPMSIENFSAAEVDSASSSEDSRESESLLQQKGAEEKEPQHSPSQEASHSSDSNISDRIFPWNPPKESLSTAVDSDSNSRDVRDSITAQVSNISDREDNTPPNTPGDSGETSDTDLSGELEDIKPTIHVARFRRTSASLTNSNSSQGYEDSCSYIEDHQDSQEIIDLENYNCSDLYDEDRFSQLIEISSDEEMDQMANELTIDLAAVKKEKEDDSYSYEEPDPAGAIQEPVTHQDASSPDPLDDPAYLLAFQDSDDIMLWEDFESPSGVAEEPEPPEDSCFSDTSEDPVLWSANLDIRSIDDDADMEGHRECQEDVQGTAGDDKEGTEIEGRTNKETVVGSEKAAEDGNAAKIRDTERKMGAKPERSGKKKKEHLKSSLDKQEMTSAGQTSKAATDSRNVDVPPTARQDTLPVPLPPKVPGSWKASTGRVHEVTPAAVEPLTRLRSSDEDPAFTDSYALDISEHTRGRQTSVPEGERPSAAVQSRGDRFKSRSGSLYEDFAKVMPPAQKAHKASTEGGPPRVRHISGPPTVRRTLASLATTVASRPGPSSYDLESLPHYAQSVYAQSTVTPSVSQTTQVQGSTPTVSMADQGVSHPHAEARAKNGSTGLEMNRDDSSAQQAHSDPTDSNPQPVEQQFQFFTTDPRTASTGASLTIPMHGTSLGTSATSANICQTQTSALASSLGSTSKEVPSERSRTDRQPAPAVQGSSGLPRVLLQRQAAVEIPRNVGFSESDLFYWIIGWNSQWLGIYGPQADGQPSSVPPILSECPFRTLCRVPILFDSFNDYYKVFVPLLLHEIWAQIRNKSDMSQPKIDAIFGGYVQEEQRPTGSVLTCTCGVALTEGARPLNVQDVVLLSPSEDAVASWYPLLAIVTSAVPKLVSARNSTNHAAPSNGTPSAGAGEKMLEVSLLVLAKNEEIIQALRMNRGHKVRLKVLQSLVPAVRQFRGLLYLPKCRLLASDILRFRNMDVFRPAPANAVPIEPETCLNPCQLQAINAASEAVAQPDTLPRICLIQGAPGTGKTRTVIELVKRILRNRKNNTRSNSVPGQHGQDAPPKPPPILLCAPSHPAVNFLLRRLTGEIPTTFLHQQHHWGRGGTRHYHVVRVGWSQFIHETVKRYSLDSQVQAKRKEEEEEISLNQSKKTSRQEWLQKEISKLATECGRCQLSGNSDKLKRVQREKDRLTKELWEVNVLLGHLRQKRAELDSRPNLHYQQVIIRNADIICCTVNGSGHELLTRMSGTDGRQQPMKFSCVIVDEANQCTELDSIIPLEHCSMKVVLVGDPQQLPAAVTSKEASHCGLRQSLFERLCKWFLGSVVKPIHLLQRQYRMHMEIAAYPSKCSYNGSLQNDKSLLKRKAFFFHPFLIFNVMQGKEVPTSGRSFTNESEAEMVMALYTSICYEKMRQKIMCSEPLSLGIITPYKEQVTNLSRGLKKAEDELVGRPANFKLPVIEVSEVELFQGREKDMVILSCVQAQGPSDHLGMLGDSKILNFILTRARYSLFIVGHLPTLQKNRDWSKLVADAAKRKLIIDVQGNDYIAAAKRCSKNGNASSGKAAEHGHRGRGQQDWGGGTREAQGAASVRRGSGRTVGETASRHSGSINAPSTSTSQQGSLPDPSAKKAQLRARDGETDAKNGTSRSGIHPLKQKLLSSRNQSPDQSGSSNKTQDAAEVSKKSIIAPADAKKTFSSLTKKVSFQVTHGGAGTGQLPHQSLIPKPMQAASRSSESGKQNPYRMAPSSPRRSKLTRSPKLPSYKQALKHRQLQSPRRRSLQASPTRTRENRSAGIRRQGTSSLDTEPTRQREYRDTSPRSPSTSSGGRPANGSTNPGPSGHGSSHTRKGSPARQNPLPSAQEGHKSPTLLVQSPRKHPAGLDKEDQLRRTVQRVKGNQGQEKKTKPLSGLQPDPKLARRRQRSGSTSEARAGESSGQGGPVRVPYFPTSDSD